MKDLVCRWHTGKVCILDHGLRWRSLVRLTFLTAFALGKRSVIPI